MSKDKGQKVKLIADGKSLHDVLRQISKANPNEVRQQIKSTDKK